MPLLFSHYSENMSYVMTTYMHWTSEILLEAYIALPNKRYKRACYEIPWGIYSLGNSLTRWLGLTLFDSLAPSPRALRLHVGGGFTCGPCAFGSLQPIQYGRSSLSGWDHSCGIQRSCLRQSRSHSALFGLTYNVDAHMHVFNNWRAWASHT